MNLVTKLVATARAVANHPLRNESKPKAIWNFGIAQIASRLVRGNLAVPFPNQTQVLLSPSMKGAAHFISPGLCEFEEMSFVAHYLRPDDLFIDVGANVGAYTVLASAIAGANSISFEPSPSTFRFLLGTVQLNKLQDKVATHNLALGSKKGSLQFTETLGTENHLCLDDNQGQGIRVEVSTLDHILKDKNPAFIKIDVEGFEPEVLAGAHDTLRKESLLAMIIEKAGNASRYGFDESKLHREIQSLGFAPYAYNAIERLLTPLPAEAVGNIIYLRDADDAGNRTRSAPTYEFNSRKI